MFPTWHLALKNPITHSTIQILRKQICDCKLIELNLSSDDSKIVHFQDLSSDQEEDTNGSEIDDPECSIK